MNHPQQPSATILIIDDDPLILTAVAAVLNMSGYECHCAQDAQAARKAAQQLSLDLIICDVQLGDDNGLELCPQLKQFEGAKAAPVIFCSSGGDKDVVRRTHEAGGVYYLQKPFDPNVLMELVDRALWMPHLVNTRIRAKMAMPVG